MFISSGHRDILYLVFLPKVPVTPCLVLLYLLFQNKSCPSSDMSKGRFMLVNIVRKKLIHGIQETWRDIILANILMSINMPVVCAINLSNDLIA